MLHGRDGVRWVMSCTRFPPDVALCIQAKELNFCLIRPQNLLPRALRVFPMHFLPTPGMLSCPFSQEWLPCGHSPMKPRFVKCCRDCCPSSRFSHLSEGTLWFCQRGHSVIGHLYDQGASCLVAHFGQMASSR